jgi:Ca2+-binding RTX toxin-like protein
MNTLPLPVLPLVQTPKPQVSIPSSTTSDPKFLVQPGQGFDGVVRLDGDGTCTGALLQDGLHILTAAHCFDINDSTPNLNPDPSKLSIVFDLPSGQKTVAVAQIFVHPGYTAGNDDDNDLAIVRLAQSAPNEAERYDLYTETNEIGKTFTRVGYGVSGTGSKGEIKDEEGSIKRFGSNTYDALGDVYTQVAATLPGEPLKPNNSSGLQLAYDFDNGTATNDALGRDFGLVNLGVDREVGTSRGDSGGPAFIDGKIAGVASYGISTGADIDFVSGDAAKDSNNTSFGELFADARVSSYLGWIGATLAQSRSGNDTMLGTTRDDTLFGNQGDDTITVFAGNDLVLGGQGNDVITGDEGSDILSGNKGNDTIQGGAGNDTIVGGQEDDGITAGAGDDRLSGDRGRDTLTGGEGADVFQFSINSEIEIITDFVDGVDRLSVIGLSFTDLTISSDGGTGTVITNTANPTLSVTLQTLSPGAVTIADFI